MSFSYAVFVGEGCREAAGVAHPEGLAMQARPPGRQQRPLGPQTCPRGPSPGGGGLRCPAGPDGSASRPRTLPCRFAKPQEVRAAAKNTRMKPTPPLLARWPPLVAAPGLEGTARADRLAQRWPAGQTAGPSAKLCFNDRPQRQHHVAEHPGLLEALLEMLAPAEGGVGLCAAGDEGAFEDHGAQAPGLAS